MDEDPNTVLEKRSIAVDIRRPPTGQKIFSEGYKMSIFSLWYELGKCPTKTLYKAIKPDPVTGELPTFSTLQTWINTEFDPRGEVLDRQVEEIMQARLIQDKVQMLDQHTRIAQEMQTAAWEYLDAHREDLKVPNAVRMLVEGVRIERESRGIPQMLEKMVDRSSEDLLKELQEIVTKAPVTIEPNDG